VRYNNRADGILAKTLRQTMDKDSRTNVKEALFHTIQSQIDSNTPRETKETYDRLTREGRPHEEAMRLIARALLKEMNDMLKSGRPFQEDRYIKALRALPKSE
jgi:hypothetical protein